MKALTLDSVAPGAVVLEVKLRTLSDFRPILAHGAPVSRQDPHMRFFDDSTFPISASTRLRASVAASCLRIVLEGPRLMGHDQKEKESRQGNALTTTVRCGRRMDQM